MESGGSWSPSTQGGSVALRVVRTIEVVVALDAGARIALRRRREERGVPSHGSGCHLVCLAGTRTLLVAPGRKLLASLRPGARMPSRGAPTPNRGV